jgi:hypothetical protein
MFYEVRIKSPKGDLKKIITTQELSKAYWDSFNNVQLLNPETLKLLREHNKRNGQADFHTGNDPGI